jgi:hypothetical protein
MTEKDCDDVLEALTVLAEHYQRPVSRGNLLAYLEALKPLGRERALDAIQAGCRGRFLPTIHNLLEFAGAAPSDPTIYQVNQMIEAVLMDRPISHREFIQLYVNQLGGWTRAEGMPVAMRIAAIKSMHDAILKAARARGYAVPDAATPIIADRPVLPPADLTRIEHAGMADLLRGLLPDVPDAPEDEPTPTEDERQGPCPTADGGWSWDLKDDVRFRDEYEKFSPTQKELADHFMGVAEKVTRRAPTMTEFARRMSAMRPEEACRAGDCTYPDPNRPKIDRQRVDNPPVCAGWWTSVHREDGRRVLRTAMCPRHATWWRAEQQRIRERKKKEHDAFKGEPK